jgi:acyl carrier protein
MDMSQSNAVEEVLRSEFGGALGKGTLDPTDDLIARGVIDSFGLISLIAALERTFGIEIGEEDVVPEHFQTLERLTAFVEAKRSAPLVAEQSDAHAGD